MFKRLERLRLVVPQVQQRGAKPAPAAGPGDERLARMHRLVQDVVRNRLGPHERSARQEVVYRHADDRGDWLESHWGRPDWPGNCLACATWLSGESTRETVAGICSADSIAHAALACRPHAGCSRALAAELRPCSSGCRDAAPENADYARDLSVSYDKLGDLARSGGDPAAARRYYEDGLTIAKRLADAAPENADYARDLSISYERLGDLARSGGDPAAARRYYEDGLTIRKRLADAAPENADYARDLSISYDSSVTWRGPAATRRRPGGTTRTA